VVFDNSTVHRTLTSYRGPINAGIIALNGSREALLMTKLRALLFIPLMLCVSAATQSNSSDNRGPDLSGSWPTTMTLRVLQDAGLVDAGRVDSSGTPTVRLVSEKVGKNSWHQFYFVRFRLRTGNTVEAIAAIDASTVADMQSGPAVYVVSKVLNPDGKPLPQRP
jgi:hypothetical protein